MIPKIIHQSYPDETRPVIVNSQRSISHTTPTWDYKFWSDDMAEKFVQKNHPDVFDIWYGLSRSDIIKWNTFRFMLIYHEGGMYVDSDTIFKKNIDDIIDTTYQFIGTRHHCSSNTIKDHFFLAERKSPLLLNIINKIKKQLVSNNIHQNIHAACGCVLINNELTSYIEKNKLKYKLLDPKYITNQSLRCEGYDNQVEESKKFNWNDVYVVHMLENSWN